MYLILRPIFTLLVICFFACAPSNTEDDSFQDSIDLSLAKENDWKLSDDVLDLINTHRVSLGKNALTKDTLYATALAVKHSKAMAATKRVNHNNFFARSAALKERGAVKVSENIAYAYSTAETVVNAWLKSSAHKEILEGDFTHIGFGILKSDTNRYYFTTLYYK